MVQHVKQRWCLQTQLLNLDKAIHDKDGKLCNQHKKNTHIGMVETDPVLIISLCIALLQYLFKHNSS